MLLLRRGGGLALALMPCANAMPDTDAPLCWHSRMTSALSSGLQDVYCNLNLAHKALLADIAIELADTIDFGGNLAGLQGRPTQSSITETARIAFP